MPILIFACCFASRPINGSPSLKNTYDGIVFFSPSRSKVHFTLSLPTTMLAAQNVVPASMPIAILRPSNKALTIAGVKIGDIDEGDDDDDG